MIPLATKQKLLDACLRHMQEKKDRVEERLETIVESLEQATKSSAGDKHETGRAMLQLDRENLGNQLGEIEKTQALLKRIDLAVASEYIRLGSLVVTNAATYFLCASVGTIEVEGITYYGISSRSPMGSALLGETQGNTVFCNGRKIYIEKVH